MSPLLGKTCRFYSSCSEYTYQAISKYGKKGLYKGIKRFLSCHPFIRVWNID
ncbi:membrane protein insertion efficiency factor YidD [bacterium]|nr:membrane protein insertion efficiency factor YidD [bacterium]MBU1599470.1 membrane protein insertion efficiency factor YidD [bacterium]